MLTLGSICIYIIILYSCLFHIQAQEVQAQEVEINICNTIVNYTSNSPFRTNLNSLLSSFLTNGPRDGFFNNTVGASPDTVYGLVSCRGDLSMDDCGRCLNNATANITQFCPTGRDATLRYQYCLVRYSNRPFFSEGNNTPIAYHSRLNVSEADAPRYNQQLGDLMRNLTNDAAIPQSRYAYGLAAYNNFENIYGLAQCTRDLSPSSCLSCLQSMYRLIPLCCANIIGARIVSTTCNIRYEISPFVQSIPEPPPSTSPSPVIRRRNSPNIVVILVPTILGLCLLQLFAYLIIRRIRRNKRKTKSDTSYDQSEISSEESLQFDVNTIRMATDDFSEANMLGQGGFGAVYRGELADGRLVAVKRLSQNSGQGLQEFKNEVMLLHKLQHRNLVKLLGFCFSGQEKLLIYEYVPNRSLDKYIFDPIKKAELDWERRYKIIGGIARGLVYLHEDSRLRIIHRDLKAGNILLDEEMHAKIADFGMAKLFGVDQTQGNTSKIAGTFGYMAPEYALNGLFSVKSDVFSFGVLLLEILSGRKTNDVHASGPSRDLLSYAWKLWREGNALTLIDPTLMTSFLSDEVMRCIHIGFLCVQENLDDRPTMSSVVLMLNSYSLTLKAPSQPAFVYQTRTNAIDLITINDSTGTGTGTGTGTNSATSSMPYSGDEEASLTAPR